MEEEQKEIKQKKEKIKNWLKNKNNLLILGIIIFAIIIRFYYFDLTKNQPLWWDEAGYMSTAKLFAGGIGYELESIRLPGFSLTASLFFILGIESEPIIRFFLLFIPSIVLIILTYIMLIEMYSDKRIAIISTLILIVLWENLFYSNRFHTENFATIFQFLSIIVFFRCYIKGKRFLSLKPKYSWILIFLFMFLSVFYRPGNILFIPAIFLFIPIVYSKNIFKNKKSMAIFGIIIFILLILLIIAFPIISKNSLISTYYHPENPIAWNVLNVFNGFYISMISSIPSVFYYSFILGLLIFAFKFWIYMPKIKNFTKNEEDLNLKSDIFNALLLIVVLFGFIFLIRPTAYEYRWFFLLLPGMLAFTSSGIIFVSEKVAKIINKKKLSSIFIIIIVILGLYSQIVYADKIIKIKIPSYQEVKDSGLWLKSNSAPSDVIVSASKPQHFYYSERKIYDFGQVYGGEEQNDTLFNKKILEIRPKYIVISAFEKLPQWAYTWPERNKNWVIPVNAYFADKEKKQPTLIIYEIDYNALAKLKNETSISLQDILNP